MATQHETGGYKPKHIARSGEGAVDFPFDEICRRLDGEDEDETDEAITSRDSTTDMGKALNKLFTWIKSVRAQDQRAVKAIGTRLLAAAWVISPEAPSHMVAKSYGLDRDKFSKKAAEFSREFGISNKYQDHHTSEKIKGEWSELELQILATYSSDDEVSKRTGRSLYAVEQKRIRIRKTFLNQ
ncbi:MAG: hypothetical protein WCH99_04100 [Verrucomicrobiota bacterium]